MRRAAWVLAIVVGCTATTEHVEPASSATEHDVDVEMVPGEPELSPVDDRLRDLGIGPIRTHPLWPTPSNDACPAAMFASLGPSLNAGDMFRRTHARLAAGTAAPSTGVAAMLAGPRMTDLAVLRHHLGVPGLRLVAALDYSSSCMMGWSHKHCFVTAGAEYCAGGGAEEIARMVRELGLAPDALDSAGWFELVVALLGVEHMVLRPDEISACTRVKGANTVEPEVTIAADRVTVQLTAIEAGAGVLHYVVIEAGGEVRATRHVLWKAPNEDDMWGELDEE